MPWSIYGVPNSTPHQDKGEPRHKREVRDKEAQELQHFLPRFMGIHVREAWSKELLMSPGICW